MMKIGNLLKIVIAVIVGELVLVLGTTIAQEVLFNGIGLSSPLPELFLGGLATFVAAILAGFAARITIKKPVQAVAIAISAIIAIETSYLIISNKTADPAWFDILAGASLILGIWIGFYTIDLSSRLKGAKA